jgi:uncharacterized protein (TIGR03435 family)
MKIFSTLLFAAAVLCGQPAKKLAFEVVSIKPNNSGTANQHIRGLGDPGGRFSVSNVDLRFLIAAAYADPNLPPFAEVEITGLSGWANTARFDVEAQAEAGSNPSARQKQEMLQSMLEDRFQLKIRVEPKERPIYNLIVDTGGLKMKPYVAPAPGAAPAPPVKPPAVPKGANRFRLNADMERIAAFLTANAERKVVGKTGLTGIYEFDLTWAPDALRLPPGAEIDPNVPSLLTAIREQLGLRLVAETGTIDMFVVESIQRPSEN